MQFITPVQITDAMLVASSIPEADYAAWNAATSYAEGDLVIRASTHRVYQRLAPGGTTATAPELDPTNWVEVAPTNRWAMFDQATGTVSEAAGEIAFTIAPGKVRGLALMDLNASSVTVEMVSGAFTVFSRTVSLGADYGVVDWFSYFFGDIVTKRTMVITDLPPYSDGEITVTITGGTQTQVGTVAVGSLFDLGMTLHGLALGVLDYSSKQTSAFGVTTVYQRPYAKRMEARVVMKTWEVDEAARRLQLIRAMPVVWIGGVRFDQSVVYGFLKDWAIDIAYADTSNLTLTIEGLI